MPQLYVSTGATFFDTDRKDYPWTLGWQPDYQAEGAIYGRRIKANTPNAKVAILYQNDDYGKDYIAGLESGLGKNKSQIVATRGYNLSDASVASQLIALRSIGGRHADDLRDTDAHDPYVCGVEGDRLEAGHDLPQLRVGDRHVHDHPVASSGAATVNGTIQRSTSRTRRTRSGTTTPA